MKRSFSFIILLILAFTVQVNVNAQCKTFAKETGRTSLKPFTHDGNYNAAVMIEGEEADLYKTFYSGSNYRISVIASEPLTKVEFSVADENGKVIYTNAGVNYKPTWDFNIKTTQQLHIIVKVPTRNENQSDAQQGCVAILFGFKEK